jgi:AcrR family transcriptional regulator
MAVTDIVTPARRRESARERILDVAEASVLQKGFGATSIEEIIVATGITKSGFFYHFHDKNDLAKALIERYLERDTRILDELFARADELNDDPLHGFLVGLKMFAEMMGNLPDVHPGCLAASYCYQEQLFSRDVRELSQQGTLRWRKRFGDRLKVIAERYPVRGDVDLDALADMAAAIVDGGITLSKTLKDASLLPKQVMLYRAFVKSVFDPSV